MRISTKLTRRIFKTPLVLLLVVCAGVSGCASLYKKPVSDRVISARQLSLGGMEAIQRGEWDKAQTMLQEAVKTCPEDQLARRRYADVLWQQGKKTEALLEMEEAVALSGGEPEMLVHLGRMNLEQGSPKLAERRAQQAIEGNQAHPAAWALQGDALREQGQLQEALASYHRALSYQSHLPDVQLATAQIYLQLQRPQRALGTLAAMSEHYPPHQTPRDLYFLRGLALKMSQRYEDASIDLARAARQGPASASILYELSEAQMLAGDRTAARFTIEQALELSPGHAPSIALQTRLAAPARVAAIAP